MIDRKCLPLSSSRSCTRFGRCGRIDSRSWRYWSQYFFFWRLCLYWCRLHLFLRRRRWRFHPSFCLWYSSCIGFWRFLRSWCTCLCIDGSSGDSSSYSSSYRFQRSFTMIYEVRCCCRSSSHSSTSESLGKHAWREFCCSSSSNCING